MWFHDSLAFATKMALFACLCYPFYDSFFLSFKFSFNPIWLPKHVTDDVIVINHSAAKVVDYTVNPPILREFDS